MNKEIKSVEETLRDTILEIFKIIAGTHDEFLPKQILDHEQSELYMYMAKRIAEQVPVLKQDQHEAETVYVKVSDIEKWATEQINQANSFDKEEGVTTRYWAGKRDGLEWLKVFLRGAEVTSLSSIKQKDSIK